MHRLNTQRQASSGGTLLQGVGPDPTMSLHDLFREEHLETLNAPIMSKALPMSEAPESHQGFFPLSPKYSPAENLVAK